jgi:lysophospholipase L1-like esterase
VTATVFYDENANGVLDAREGARIPNAIVTMGGASGSSAMGSGQAVVQGVPSGAQTASIRPDSLPPLYVAGPPRSIQVPQTGELRLPVTLSIGDNQPNVYLAFGDSISNGVGSSDGKGYRARLEGLLGSYFGQAEVKNESRDGSFTSFGGERIPGSMSRSSPAYALVLYGTNDWHSQACQTQPPAACFTIDSLRIIVRYIKRVRSIPVLATLPPVNPALAPPERNQWTSQMNEMIKSLATEEGCLLADTEAAFRSAGNLSSLYSDDVHPNDAGYQVLAQALFRAITGRAAP